ncbi:hypothetical protein MAHJHV64_09670 [Mycobacterium avium subsp. hominissuis]|uniref:Uncharacterized protein n=1 Tax=Mycobacterium avium subsp. hominissuis TaxID=439334 RepID=A0A088DHA6_MYCAV|nr:hypothetical protein [Mycobacterium avium subsp. hominissuis]
MPLGGVGVDGIRNCDPLTPTPARLAWFSTVVNRVTTQMPGVTAHAARVTCTDAQPTPASDTESENQPASVESSIMLAINGIPVEAADGRLLVGTAHAANGTAHEVGPTANQAAEIIYTL